MDLVHCTHLESQFLRIISSTPHNDGLTWHWSYRMLEVHSGWREGRLKLLHHPGWQPNIRIQDDTTDLMNEAFIMISGGSELEATLQVEPNILSPVGHLWTMLSPKVKLEGDLVGNVENRRLGVARQRRELQEEEHEALEN